MEIMNMKNLDHMEEELYALFDYIPETEWVNRAIALYRTWLEREPQNEKIRDQLLGLLLRSGGDKKRRLNHYSEARRMF